MTVHMIDHSLLQRSQRFPIKQAVLPKFVQERAQGLALEMPASSPLASPQTDTFPVIVDDDRFIHSYRTRTSAKTNVAWRWVFDKWLIGIEIGAVVGFMVILVTFGQSVMALNREADSFQRQAVAQIEAQTKMPATTIPQTTTTTPATNQPTAGLLTNINTTNRTEWVDDRPSDLETAYVVADSPTSINEAPVIFPFVLNEPKDAGIAQRIQIPALGIDKPIFQGDDEANLKLGVGQYGSSAKPGVVGNMVLAAHNDIYGQIFRHLDKLIPGDEIIISTKDQRYTYVIREIQQVDPTETWVLNPTDNATTTLISCYPYLINNKRIVVFADLVSDNA